MNIERIESLTYTEATGMALEKLNIKGHDCFICDLGGNFGYSILVFKNGKHIYYANDYELHHDLVEKLGREALRDLYIKGLENKLFTDEELLKPCKSYDEYKRKSYFVQNYWIMRYDRISIFFIGTDTERAERIREQEKNFPYYNPYCFCYVKDESIVSAAGKYFEILKKSYQELQEDLEEFRKMVSYELANHEACITCDYRDALGYLGLKYEELPSDKQKIVKEELRRQIESYC